MHASKLVKRMVFLLCVPIALVSWWLMSADVGHERGLSAGEQADDPGEDQGSAVGCDLVQRRFEKFDQRLGEDLI